MTLVDLTHTFECAMPVFAGDTVPEIRRVADIASSGYCDHLLRTGMHAGTHMDGPLHMLEDGAALSDIPIERFFGRGVLIRCRGCASIDSTLLEGVSLQRGDIVLLMTGLSERYREPEYFSSFPEVSPAFAEALVKAGVSAVGMDTPSPDRAPYRVHKILLGHQVLIIENLTNLAALEDAKRFEIAALPAKFHTDAAPARVIARVFE